MPRLDRLPWYCKHGYLYPSWYHKEAGCKSHSAAPVNA